uniref:RRM domain-containing protein n=1 Tax=Globisporangium ultimum (strain ATCC 200006 / CBS 805.95 / DAOM BR144) TaxID=431595 RepID=K3WL69_GLOUD
MSDSSAKLGKIFIGGLSYETTDEKLRSYFAAYGSVTDAVVMKDPISRRSRGFGFITYADPGCVDRALAHPNHILDSRRVEAKRAVPRAESARDMTSSSSSSSSRGMSNSSSIPSSNLSLNSSHIGATKKIFVGGLHYETKDADFKKYFAQYGKVVSAEVMFNRETNKSRGFGFVIFEVENSVDLVLQEPNHVIDGKSVEVKRAVPRTDVPPARSVSSRAGSFSGTGGPGSVGSLEDVSVSSTATLSMPGTPSRATGSSNSSRSAMSSSPAPANLMANGTLVGYAAAVRYGGRGIPKPTSSIAPVLPPSAITDSYKNNDDSDDHAPPDGVADALSSLALGDSSATPSLSASSSLESPSKLLDAAGNGHFSPLGSAIMSPLAADPVIEQWNLSPAAPPQPSVSSEVPFLGQSKSRYLSGAIRNDDVTDESSQLPWQAAPWDHAWPSLQPQQHSNAPESQRSPSSPSFFPMFSTQGMNASGSPMSESAWNPPEYVTGNGFGNGMMGMGGSGFGSNGSNGRMGRGGGAFGNGGLGGVPRSSSPYSSLGGFLQAEYLPQQEPELPLDTGFGSLIADANLGPDDSELEKKQHLDFALPSSSTGFQRHYR